MTQGPIQLDVSVCYGLPRTGLPSAASFRRWAAAACEGRIMKADLAIRLKQGSGAGFSCNPAKIDGGGPNNVVPDHAACGSTSGPRQRRTNARLGN